MRNVLILLLISIFLVGCQTTSKVEEEPKEAEEMTSDAKMVKIKLNESIEIEGLEIFFTKYLERWGADFWYTIFDLMLKKGEKSKNITFTVKPKIVNPIENWEGYQITYLDGFRGEIKLKIEKEPENKK